MGVFRKMRRQVLRNLSFKNPDTHGSGKMEPEISGRASSDSLLVQTRKKWAKEEIVRLYANLWRKDKMKPKALEELLSQIARDEGFFYSL